MPVSDTAIPNIFTTIAKNAVGVVPLLPRKTHTVRAITDVSGQIKHSKSTLILGAPGSGKSVLLRMLAGRAVPDAGSALTYRGETPAQLAAGGTQLRKLVSYAPQVDTHEPLLTVRETFDFIHATATPRPRAGAPPEDVAAYVGA